MVRITFKDFLISIGSETCGKNLFTRKLFYLFLFTKPSSSKMIKVNSYIEDPSLALMRQMLKEDGFDEAAIEFQLSQYKHQNKNYNHNQPSILHPKRKEKEENNKESLWSLTDEQVLNHVFERFGKETMMILNSYMLRQQDEKQRQEKYHEMQEENIDPVLWKEFYQEEKELQDRLRKQKDCPICIENLLSKDTLGLKNCIHVYHIECLETQIAQNIKDRRFPIRCPIPACRKEISFGDIMNSLQKRSELQQDYYQHSLKFCLESNPEEFLNCPTPDCDYAFLFDPAGPRFDCPKCKKSYCVPCKTNWHFKQRCEEYKAKKEAQSDEVFFKFANQKNFKKCPQCHFWIEKSEGCNHMKCSRCQTPFCYRCGLKRDGTCKCG